MRFPIRVAALATVVAAGGCSGGGHSSAPPTSTTLIPDTIAALGIPPADSGRTSTGVDVTGQGDAQVPATGDVTVGDGWAVAYAWTCPFASAKPPAKVALTAAVVGAPDDPALGVGDAGSSEQAMRAGGRVTLRVTTTSPRCRWRIVILGARNG